MTIRNREEAESAVTAAGSHWFDADTMRFFRTRVGQFFPTPGGAYFVTSEEAPSDARPRRWSVRYIGDDGTITTVGDFQAYGTPRQAKAVAHNLSTIGNHAGVEGA